MTVFPMPGHLLFRFGSSHIYAKAQQLVRSMKKMGKHLGILRGIFEEVEAKKGPAPAFSAGAGKLPAEGRCRTRFVSRGKIIPLFVDFPPAASETPGVRG